MREWLPRFTSRSGTRRSVAGLMVFAIGAVLAITGFASLAFPGITYPSVMTCIVNYDMLVCSSTPWAWSSVALAIGVSAMAWAYYHNRSEGH